jgi:hypothetical protein
MLLGILISTVVAGYVIGLAVMGRDVRERTWATVTTRPLDDRLSQRGLTR